MPYLAIFLLLVVVGTFLFVRLRKSKWVDNFAYDLTHEETYSKNANDLIDDAKSAGEALNQRVADNAVAVAIIEKDTQTIKKFTGEPVAPNKVEDIGNTTEGGGADELFVQPLMTAAWQNTAFMLGWVCRWFQKTGSISIDNLQVICQL